jgi:hypothetical protein
MQSLHTHAVWRIIVLLPTEVLVEAIFFFSDPQERVSLYETKIGYYLDELKGMSRYVELKYINIILIYLL